MSTQAAPVYSPYRWLLHALLICYYLMGFIVRFAWPPLSSVAGPELGMDMTRVGSYMSAFYIGYVLMHIPAGVLGDRFGVRGVITLALVIEGLSTMGMGMANSYAVGFILRLAAGLGAGMVYASCMRCVTRWFPPGEHGLAFGFLLMAPMGGGVLLPNLLMPWLAGLWEWRGAFVAVGALSLCLAAIALMVLRDIGSAGRGKSFFAGLKYIFSQRNLILCSLVSFCLMWAQITFVSWSNYYLRSIDFTLAQAGLVMMVFGVGGCIGPIAAGWLCDRMHPKWVMAVCLLVCIPLMPLFGGQTGMSILILCAGLCGLFLGAANPPMVTLVAQFAGKEWSATAGGVSGCIHQIGSILGPLFIGMSIDATGSYTTGWWMMSTGALVGILLVLPVGRPPRG